MRKSAVAKKRVKLACLKLARGLGLFALARLFSAHRLRILCYHAFGTEEDIRFSPGLFMRLDTIQIRGNEREPRGVMIAVTVGEQARIELLVRARHANVLHMR